MSLKLQDYVYEHVDVRGFTTPPPPRDGNGQDGSLRATLHPMAARLLRDGLRSLAQVHHRDHGGDDATMRAIRETYEALRASLLDGARQ